MSAPSEPIKSPTVSGPESPTTARPLEMDDDDVQETGIIGEEAPAKPAAPGTAQAPAAAEEVPPPKPPRPVSEQQQNEQILKEAFPSVDLVVIKAVLTASSGRIEPAFNALLEMTDPDAAKNEQPPPPPPRPIQQPVPTGSTPQSQLEADELYARQLAEHYESVGAYEARTSNQSNRSAGGPPYPPRPRGETGLKPNEMWGDKEHSFIEDDLPAIRENLRKGFVETQNKVNSWFTNIKKKIDEEWVGGDDDDEGRAESQNQRRNVFMGRPTRDGTARRSGDYDRYDADPELLSDDFAGMKFHSDGTPVRPLANPNLFRPPPPASGSATSPKAGERKVAFREGTDDMDAYNASPKLPPKDGAPGSASSGIPSGGAAKPSKWQPLTTVEPSPIAENDPFSLGDSEDERDNAHSSSNNGGGKAGGEIKAEDSERLRKAAAEAMADSLVDEAPKGAEESKKS